MAGLRGKLTFANVMSTIAVFLALASGSFAVAAALEKDSVKSKQVKDGSLKDIDLVPTEDPHETGSPGEPAFGNGAEGDCLWADGGLVGAEVGFYRDVSGRVHLEGVAAVEDGNQGDSACMDGPSEQFEDMRVFTLPEGYRPPGPEQFYTGSFAHGASVIVNGTDEINISGSDLAPGEVIIIPTVGSELPEGVPLGGVSFDAG